MENQRKMHVLPIEAYTSKEWFDLEMKHLFSTTWQYAGLFEDVSNPGDYISLQAGLNNIFIVKGRVDSEAINWFINEYPPYAQNTEYFICGPGKMIENTKEALKNIDVPDNRIFIESFGGSSSDNTIEGIEKAALKAKLNNQEINISIEKEETVLRALLNNKFDPPYSCEGGV